MEHDSKTNRNTWHEAICLLEVHLTRANRVLKLRNQKLMAGANENG